LEDARAYIVKNEHTTPLISCKGKPLEIPEKIHGKDHIHESERPWEFYNRWLANNKLFGAISAGFPKEHKQHCTYRQDERGYSLEQSKSSVQIIVDGVEELFYENGNIRAKTTWKGGLKNGPSTEYYENGQVHMKGAYKEDETHGSYERFHENGQLRSKGQLSEGEQVGYWEWYDEEGNLIETKDF
jgi:antitoxin component YwqK of YwqJK toxin-antitoxin module